MIRKVPRNSKLSMILQNGNLFLGILYPTLLAEQARITLTLIDQRETVKNLVKYHLLFLRK